MDQLITDHQRLSALCLSLTAERDALSREKRTQQERIKDLEHQLSVLQLCEGLGSSPVAERDQAESKNRARARVNRLMREVDKCINLLSAHPEVVLEEAKTEE